MTGWIGINDYAAPLFALQGLARGGDGRRAAPDELMPDELMPVGTLLLDLTLTADAAPRPLLALNVAGDWPRGLHLALAPGRRLTLHLAQGSRTARTTLALPPGEGDLALRIALSWDAPARRGHLAAEDIATGTLCRADLPAPPPLLLADTAALIHDRARRHADPAVTLLALSDRVEPFGLFPRIAEGTPILTETGLRPVQTLRRGDLIRTAEGALMPLRWITCCDLPAAGSFAPVLLRAPYLGLRHDILVAPQHRMLLSGIDAEYLFGAAGVLVAAGQVLQSGAARRLPGRGIARFHHLLLDSHAAIGMGGTWGESLDLSPLAATPGLAAMTPLAGLPASALPRHNARTARVLRSFESDTLLRAMIA